MKFNPSFRNQKGFSLVELMIVVGIIGILSTLALPRFKQFQYKAKMGEAKNILSYVFTLQQTYALDNNTFVVHGRLGRTATGTLTTAGCTQDAGAKALGFKIEPCAAGAATPRYGYTTAAGAAGISSTFTTTAASGGAAAANSICPGNAVHSFTITQGNVLTEPSVATACPN